MAHATAEVGCIIRENHHVKVNDVVGMLDISHGSAHHTICGVLQFYHVSVRWVPDGFSGLVVSMLASGTRVHGFKPGRSHWIFRASEKSSASLPSEGK